MVHLRRYFLPVLALLLLLAAVLISFSNTPTLAQDCTTTTSIVRVSVASGGAEGNGDSYLSAYQTISADGRYVVFTSNSTLVPEDTNVCGYFSCGDVYVHDRQTGKTERVSVATGGAQGNLASGDGVMTPDGRYIAFSSEADNLVSGDTNGVRDIFVHDRQTRETRRVSLDSVGNQADNYSDFAVISGDGQIIAFQSYASNLVSDDTNGVEDIFVRDLQESTTTRISVSSTGTQGNGWSTIPAMSANGQFVIFESRATNLVEGDYDGQLYLHDRQTGATSIVSVNSNNDAAAGFVIKGSISDDGRFIAFHSDATNLAFGYTPDYWFDIFLHNRLIGETSLFAENPDAGRQFTEGSSRISFSQDERYLAFTSTAANPGSDSLLGEYDVFILDTQTGQTKIATHSWDATPPYNSSFSPSLSADGKFVVFDSWQENLVSGDTNLQRDVFVASVDCLPSAPTPTPTEEATPEETPTEEVTPEVTPTAAPTSLPNAVPQRNYITTQPITLTWNPVTWAARYQVQVDTSTAFTAPIMEAPTPELQLSPLEPRTYFWRVRAIRANNTPGAWSAVESFTVGMP